MARQDRSANSRSGLSALAHALEAPARVPLSVVRRARSGWRTVSRHRPPKPGSRPGTLRIAEDAAPTQIAVLRYELDALEELAVDDPERLAALRDAPGVTWVDVQGFGDEARMRRIGELFGLHPLALADVVNVPQRPKVEDYGDRHLIVTRMALVDAQGEVELEQVSLVLGPGWVLTFQERPGDVFEPVRQRIRSGVGSLRRMGPDYLVYALLAAIVDGYFPVVERIGEEVDQLEEEVLDRPSHATLQRIHALRRLLISLHRIQWRQRDALGSLLRDEALPFAAPVRVFLRDVYDHSVQVLDVVETTRDLVVGLLEIYLSTLSNRMNEVMKTLTVMASIFIPLTFLAGIYGMNFDYMPELRWSWGYFAVWGVMAGAALALALWFRRRGWIGRSDS